MPYPAKGRFPFGNRPFFVQALPYINFFDYFYLSKINAIRRFFPFQAYDLSELGMNTFGIVGMRETSAGNPRRPPNPSKNKPMEPKNKPTSLPKSSDNTPQQTAPTTPTESTASASDDRQVRNLDLQKLKEIIANAAMYRTSLVEACRHELELREKSKAFAQQVSKMDKAKLREVLANPQLYAEELVYACEREQAERRRIWCEQQKRKAERIRLERERKAEEARQAQAQQGNEGKKMVERRSVASKKRRSYLFAATAILAFVLISSSVIIYNSKNEFRGISAQDCYEIGRDYAYGRDDVPYDMEKAVEWYTQAAKKGHPEAQNTLGVCYEQGDGVAKNLNNAFKYYKKAAEQGFIQGQINLAECYEKGKGVTKNLHEAQFWYKKAADQGSEIAWQGFLRCQ